MSDAYGNPNSSKRAIGQFFAAAGVVLSLIFVGYEIRQNTDAVRSATLQGIADQSFQLRIMTALNAGESLDGLSPEDRTRVGWVVSATTRIMENRFRQYQLGTLDELGL